MARMSDEAFDLIQETREKKITGHSARNRRSHTGKGGGMKTASDYMTKKQLRAMDGEVVTYRLGAPMNWGEFSGIPDDLKTFYIKKLRTKFNVPDESLATAMGVELSEFVKMLKSIGLRQNPGSTDWYGTDDHGRFVTWWVIVKEEK